MAHGENVSCNGVLFMARMKGVVLNQATRQGGIGDGRKEIPSGVDVHFVTLIEV